MSNEYGRPIVMREFIHGKMYNNIYDQSRNNIDVFVRSDVRSALWFNRDDIDGSIGRRIMWQVKMEFPNSEELQK